MGEKIVDKASGQSREVVKTDEELAKEKGVAPEAQDGDDTAKKAAE